MFGLTFLHNAYAYMPKIFECRIQNIPQRQGHQMATYHSWLTTAEWSSGEIKPNLGRTCMYNVACKDMPMFLWLETSNYTTWLKNHSPSHATWGETPYSLVHKGKQNLSQAHEFGGKLYVHSTARAKLEAQAEEAIFVGIDKQSKGYWVYWPEKRHVSIECNVTFMLMTITVAMDVPDMGESVPVSAPQDIRPAIPQVQTPPIPLVTPPRSSQPIPQPTAPQVTCAWPPTSYYQNLKKENMQLLHLLKNMTYQNPIHIGH